MKIINFQELRNRVSNRDSESRSCILELAMAFDRYFEFIVNEPEININGVKLLTRKISSYYPETQTNLVDARNTREFDIFNLRNNMVHNQIPSRFNLLPYSKALWAAIPELRSIHNTVEMHNLLSYLLRVRIQTDPSIDNNKKKIVGLYKSVYNSKTKEEKQKILMVIARWVFSEFGNEDLERLFRGDRV